MREFTTAVKEVVESEEYIEVKVDDRVVRFYNPVDGQIAMVMGATGRHTSQNTKMAGIIDFLAGLMEAEDYQWFSDRMLDRHDPFGIENVEEIMRYLIEEWTARPTK